MPSLFLLLFLICFNGSAFLPTDVMAGALADFNAAMDKANQHYRAARFYLSTGNIEIAVLEVETLQDRWQELRTKFAATPPDAFAEDPEFSTVLSKTQNQIEAALIALDSADIKTADTVLMPLRVLWMELRARNAVRVYSDQISALNKQMQRVWHFYHKPPKIEDAVEIDAAKAEVAIYRYLLQQSVATASFTIQADAEFERMTKQALHETELIPKILNEGKIYLFINILGSLMSLDRLLYLHYG